jgi:hypothetical protein
MVGMLEFLHKIIQRDYLSREVGSGPGKKSDYVFRSNHLAHITLVKAMQSVAHGFRTYKNTKRSGRRVVHKFCRHWLSC